MFSVKATAAHIAFAALSRSVVDSFFVAALKAGGRIHGEPAIRDQETGYYSAAVLDFDDNSIEVMHRDRDAVDASRSMAGPENDRVRSWQKEVARSTVSQESQAERMKPRIVISNVARPTVTVAQNSSQTRPSHEMSSKALVGTLLGAAVGAAFAYAMTKSEESSKGLQTTTYQMIDSAHPSIAPSATGSRQAYPASAVSRNSQTARKQLGYVEPTPSQVGQSVAPSKTSSPSEPVAPLAIAAQAYASTLIDTFVPPSEVSPYCRLSISRSQSDGLVQSQARSKAPSQVSRQSKLSRASSAEKTVTQIDFSPSKRSSVVTEFKNALEIPLPQSKATSVASRQESDLRRIVLDPNKDDAAVSVLGSVAPSDSISQAGSKRSRSSRHSSRHHSRGKEDKSESGSRASERTVKESSSKAGRRRESIVSLPLRPSSKTSVHRSVVSFLPGL